jgi:ATP-dependent Lon protease
MAVQSGGGPADFAIPDALPVLPLQDAIVFPLTAVPLAVGQPRSVRLVDDVMRGNRLLALVAQREAKTEPATPADLYRVGTVAMIHQLARVPDGSVRLMVQGLERVRLLDWVGTEPYLVARIEVAREETPQATEVDALRRAVADIFRRLVEASPELPDQLGVAAENLTDPRHLVYFVASVVPLDTPTRQQLLEMDSATSKLRRLVDLLQRELAVRELAGRSQARPRSGSPRRSASTTCASSSDPFSGSSARRRATRTKFPNFVVASRRPTCLKRPGVRRSAN